MVESPERFLLAGISYYGEIAVDERELGMGDVEVEGALDNGFVADKIFEMHDTFDFLSY